MKRINTTAVRAFAILTVFAVVFTMMPALTGDLNAHAASYWKNVKASADGETQVNLSWKALTKKQKRKVSGIALFRDGELVSQMSKYSSSYADSGLKAGTTYSYQLKTYKKKTKTTRMWYNKATGEYQKKKPAKKDRGQRKTFRDVTYTYYNAAAPVQVTTENAEATPPSGDSQQGGSDDADTSASDDTVKLSAYKAANGYLVEAMYNADKKPGDSTGKEIRYKKYPGYKASDKSRSWGFIIRCTDPEIADKAALAASYIAKNNNFGFESREHTSQAEVSNRASIYNAVVKATGKKPSAERLKVISSVTQKADTSCTPTCLAGYWLYYDAFTDKLPMKWIPPYDTETYEYNCGAVNVEYHQLEEAIKHVNSEYKKRGLKEPFTIIYISPGNRSSFFSKSNIKKNLKRGDIICSCPDPEKGGHTAIIM